MIMKLKDGFILRSVAWETVVVPTGSDLNLNMMITLNETGKFLWEHLEKGTEEAELVDALLKEYNVDKLTAEKHVALFVKKLTENGFIK